MFKVQHLSWVLLLTITATALIATVRGRVSCKDARGFDVDWFYIYKLPKHYQTTGFRGRTSNGLKFMYLTSDSNDQWKMPHVNIDDNSSLLETTLVPLIYNNEALLVGYNDEFPSGRVVSSGGHAKGVVATDGSTGLWLIHSVPKFPDLTDYKYPSSGTEYGQSFLCITLKAEDMEKVGKQMIFNEVNTYYKRVPSALLAKYPTLMDALNKKWRKEEPFYNIEALSSLNESLFISFAKGPRYGEELYTDMVAPTLHRGLTVETWRNGPGNIESSCSGNYNVFNIVRIKELRLDIDFETTKDHSKWAVSGSREAKRFDDWICIGDINRQAHQLQRGGGTVCQKNSNVTRLYQDLIDDYEPCQLHFEGLGVGSLVG